MPNTTGQSSPYSEDWSSYRKLVVDTLKRLDDRTIDTFQRLSDLTTRVHAIENSGIRRDMDRVECDVTNLDKRVDTVEDDVADVNKVLAEQAGSKKVFVWLVGIICSIIGFIASVGADKIWPGTS